MTPHRPPLPAVDQIQPVGAKLQFIDHEWLPSMFGRVGHSLDVSADDIATWCGLGATTLRRAGIWITDEEASKIGAGLGFTPEQVHSTVLSNLPEEALPIRNGDHLSTSAKHWALLEGIRYCTLCLRERPGVFYTHWKVAWSFLCLRHGAILRSGCPSCHSDLADPSPRQVEVRDPTRCWAKLPDGSACRYPLTDSWSEERIDSASHAVAAQLAIAKATVPSASRPVVHVPLATFRGIAIALLRTGDQDLLASLAGVETDMIAGLLETNSRPEVSAPGDALMCATVFGAAYRLATDPEPDIQASLRLVTFSRRLHDLKSLNGTSSSDFILSGWPGIDRAMQGRVLRAVDHDLPPIQRLLTGSPATASVWDRFARFEDGAAPGLHGTDEHMRAILNAPDGFGIARWSRKAVPALLWPAWATPLGVAERAEAHALQASLATALRLAVTSARRNSDVASELAKRLNRSLLGAEPQTTAVLRQLCDLALQLRLSPGPIDYERRSQITGRTLLPAAHWEIIAASVGEHPGRGRRLISARRYAFLRMNPVLPRELPDTLRFRESGPTVSEYRSFMLLMSHELKQAIDDYLRAWLWQVEIHQGGRSQRRPPPDHPVVWFPKRPTSIEAGLAPELDDIAIEALHDAIRSGITDIAVLAELVGRPPRHVRWAVAEQPLPSGRPVEVIDWTSILEAGPTTNMIIRRSAKRRNHWAQVFD